MKVITGYKYRSTNALSVTLTVLFFGCALLSIIDIGYITSDIFSLHSGEKNFLEIQMENSSGTRMHVSILGGLSFLIITILFSIWIYYSNQNCRALGAKDLKFTPGRCVGSFFIPFVNLVRPYRAVVEIWKASQVNLPEERKNLPTHITLRLWWAAWIISFYFQAQASGQLEKSVALFFSYSFLFHAIAWFINALMALILVRNINNLQEEKKMMSLQEGRITN